VAKVKAKNQKNLTGVQSNLTKGRITVLPPLNNKSCTHEQVRYNGWHIPPSKVTLPVGGIWTPSNTWFLEPTSQPPNSILIGSAIFAQLTQTNRHTDHATGDICSNELHADDVAQK